MTTYTKSVEMTYEFIDSIVLGELQNALETNVKDYHNKVRVCETSKEHRKLIKSLHRTVAYFMAHDEFVEYMQEIDWPKDIKRNPLEW
jgi:uncharacterized protein YeeX (DUF496 family)